MPNATANTTPDNTSDTAPDTATHTTVEWLTVAEFCQRWRVSRSAFFEWRRKGLGPQCTVLPSGQLRIHRDELNRWQRSLPRH
ncbi:helix-turn-helix transcriptional regulator [Actinomadura rudentiformis]|uniref:Helix-turn-helix domain-containing protein n=1 Tax=Actinomadura rudentiformis TaxID=359158 RepID=A0A6H9Z876_9ACTN|nr:helix-turn-helix domain-containing protein [Actinomadura rudentiformis]KAB2351618.1 helix-turn-helix domain-containing protein [Actinomadura rudentiformis]